MHGLRSRNAELSLTCALRALTAVMNKRLISKERVG